MNIEKMLINNSRKAMLDNINALDKKTLQRQLESHLKLEFKYKDEVDRLNNIINGMEDFFKYAYDNEVKPLNDRKISVWTICLDKLKELKENKYE